MLGITTRVPPQLPAADDPGVTNLLERITSTLQARGCRLSLRPTAGGLSASYSHSVTSGRPTTALVLTSEHFEGVIEVFDGESRSDARSLQVLGEIASLALDAVVERVLTSSLARLLAAALAIVDGVTLIVDRDGDVLFATEHALSLNELYDGGRSPRLSSVSRLLARDVRQWIAEQRSVQSPRPARTVTLLDRAWRLGVWELPNIAGTAPCLVRLLPIELPDAANLLESLRQHGVSPRQAEVIACLIRGDRLRDIAARLGITEYTVKDHLKLVYTRLGVSSRAELIARLMNEGHL